MYEKLAEDLERKQYEVLLSLCGTTVCGSSRTLRALRKSHRQRLLVKILR